MSLKRKSPIAVKIIACLLLLGSLAALVLPIWNNCWLKLSADIGPEQIRMNPGELIQSFTGIDSESQKSMVLDFLQEENVQADQRCLNDLLERFLDGHFTLPGLAAVCRDVKALLPAVKALDPSFTVSRELNNALNQALWGCWGVFGLLALFGLIALACALADRRWGILLYFLFGALVAGLLLWLRSVANGFLEENVPIWKELGRIELEPMGLGSLISYLDMVDLEGFVKMGIGAYLCPFLALLALMFMCIRKKQPKSRPTPYPARRSEPSGSQEQARPVPRRTAPAAPPVWFCPNCGFRNGPNLVRCQSCGMDRPGLQIRRFCTNCGESLPPEATFCFSCGAPVAAANPTPYARPAPFCEAPREDTRSPDGF